MTHIILDCDGVLLDWPHTFAVWLGITHDKLVDPTGPSEWDLSQWLECSAVEADEYVREFNRSDEFAHIEACPHAVAGVKALVAAGHTLSIITSCGTELGVTANRRYNLKQKFGVVFDRVICLELGESKSSYLASAVTGILVEDNYAHAAMGLDAGHDVFMVRQKHNERMEARSAAAINWMTHWGPLVSHAAMGDR